MSWFNKQVNRTKKAIDNYGTAWKDVVKTGDLGQFGSDLGNSALDFYGVGENTLARKYVNSEFYQTATKVATGVGIASVFGKLDNKKPVENNVNNPNNTFNNNDNNSDGTQEISPAILIGALIFLL